MKDQHGRGDVLEIYLILLAVTTIAPIQTIIFNQQIYNSSTKKDEARTSKKNKFQILNITTIWKGKN